MGDRLSLAELIVHIQSEVQKASEFIKFSEQERGADSICMAITDFEVDLPVEIEQTEHKVDQ